MQNKENYAICRYGYVSDYDPDYHMARVIFPELDNQVSAWLPVGVKNSKNNFDECGLDIDEHVFCVMNGSGIEEGVIICALYDENNQPKKKDLDTRITEFQDGTKIFYDRKNNEFRAENISGSYISMKNGEIEIHAANHVKITAPRIDLN